MNRKTNKFNNAIDLYQIAGFDMERYVQLYRYRIAEKDEWKRDAIIPTADLMFRMGKISREEYETRRATERRIEAGEIVHIEQKRGVLKNKDRIIEKCQYLQDALIRRAFAKKDTMSFSLSSSMLKAVVGPEYKSMLDTFREMGYLVIGSDFKTDAVKKDRLYTQGEHSTIYTLKCEEITRVKCVNQRIIKYKEKTKAEYEKMKAMASADADYRYGESFSRHYIVSLRKICIEDGKGMLGYIREQVKKDHDKFHYYRFVVEALKDKDKSINRVDKAGRIYHCLTNLERELKQYLNIDYMLDCKNSHPLLFNYFVFMHYGIPSTSSYAIMSFIKENVSMSTDSELSYYHKVGKNIRKLLNINNIENQSVALLRDDELEYIYLTCTGQLWDIITARHPDKDRNEVKVQMFQEVFYSNTPYANHWKEYAVEFKKQFPSVYKKIGQWKNCPMAEEVKEYMHSRKLYVENPTTALSIAMMNLEAQIFTGILKRLYAKRWNAIHIHDCIVIPKDGNANHPTIDQVRSIMEDVYKDFGLCPTLA